ncbi:MAG TPA: MFS transporter [Halothiobacillus sp.]|nr:MFS transporter [Halothiobacillus sp.]
MLPTILSIQSLLLGMGILLAGSGLLATLLGLRAHLAGFPDVMIGLIMSGFYVGYILGTLWIPPLIRRIGHVRSFTAMAALSSATAIVHGLWVEPWAWLALRVVSGISLLGLYMVIESWLNEQSNQIRGQIFGFYMTVSLLALGAGQFLISVYGADALGSFALVALLFSLGLIPVALTQVKQPTPIQTARLSVMRLYRLAPAGATGALLSGTVTGALWGMAAVYASRMGLPEAKIALFMALLIFGGAFLQWPLGKLSDHFDRRKVLIGIAGAGVLSSFLLLNIVPVSDRGAVPVIFWVGVLLFGGFAFSLYAVSVAQTHDRLGPDQVLEATRSLLLLNGAGAILGPLLSGLFMQWLGAPGFPVFILVTLVLLMALVIHRVRHDAPAPLEERVDFVVSTRTSAVAAEFDPRIEEAAIQLQAEGDDGARVDERATVDVPPSTRKTENPHSGASDGQ